LARGVGVGSYEPGEGWERVGWMVEWIVSVVDLMEGKGGRCSRNLKLGDGDCIEARPVWAQEATHEGDPPTAGRRPRGEIKGTKGDGERGGSRAACCSELLCSLTLARLRAHVRLRE
jgi:hypothetical protein